MMFRWTAGAILTGILSVAVSASAQTRTLTILVGGSPVAASRPAELVGAEWFIPLAAVARALNIDVTTASDVSGLRARSRTGVETVYDGRTGDIRYGQIVIGSVRNYQRIVIAGPIENVLFPISGLVPLLGVDVSEDQERQVLRIEPAAGAGPGSSAPGFTLAGLDYSAGMTMGEGQLQHYTSLRGEAVAGTVSLSSQWLLNGNASRMAVRQGSAEANFGGQRVLGAGDQTAHTSVDSLMTAYRGAGFRQPVGGGFEAEVYAGRALGATAITAGMPGVPTFDSNVAGLVVNRRAKSGDLSLSGQWFDGAERSGASVGAAFVRVTRRQQVKAQLTFGDFSGLSARSVTPPISTAARGLFADELDVAGQIQPVRTSVQGRATGVGLLYTVTPLDQLSFTLQADRYGKNFLTTREDASFNAQYTRRGVVSVRPLPGLNVFAGINDRVLLLDASSRQVGTQYGASGRLPRLPLQLGVFTSRQRDAASSLGRIDVTQYSATLLGAARVSGNAYFSETQIDGVISRDVSASLGREFSRVGRLSVLGQWQIAGSRRLGLDWQRDLPAIGGMIRAAIERIDAKQPGQAPQYVPLGTLAFALPFGQHAHVSYSGNLGNRTLSVSLSGPLARRPDVRRDGERISIATTATLTGRVYFDRDNDEQFAAHNDRGLPEVRVWLDDRASVMTDATGSFVFSDVAPGAHALRAELDAVPADLAFATSPDRVVAAVPYGRNTQDFRVVRTGSAQARVIAVMPGSEEGQTARNALPEVRIVAGEHFDSYTDLYGRVVLASLPPGTYELRVDPESLPTGYAALPGSSTIEVKAGEALPEVQFLVAPVPKEVIRKDPIRRGGGGTVVFLPWFPFQLLLS